MSRDYYICTTVARVSNPDHKILIGPGDPCMGEPLHQFLRSLFPDEEDSDPLIIRKEKLTGDEFEWADTKEFEGW